MMFAVSFFFSWNKIAKRKRDFDGSRNYWFFNLSVASRHSHSMQKSSLCKSGFLSHLCLNCILVEREQKCEECKEIEENLTQETELDEIP